MELCIPFGEMYKKKVSEFVCKLSLNRQKNEYSI